MARRYLEKFWNCPSCGKRHISALRKSRCPSCGGPMVSQSEEKFSYEEINDEVGLELAKGGPHWVCSHCGSRNLDRTNNCTGCGNNRDNTDQTNQIKKYSSLPIAPEKKGADSVFESPKTENDSFHQESLDSGENNFSAQKPQTDQSSTSFHNHGFSISSLSNDEQKKPKKKTLLIILLVIVGLGLFSLFGYLIFHTNDYSGQVTEFSWQRSISIHEYRVLSEDGWTDPPYDAYNISSKERYHHTEDVYEDRQESVWVTSSRTDISYTDLGNGAVGEDKNEVDTSHWETQTKRVKIGTKDVYKTWYQYNIDRWVYSRSVPTEKNDHNPFWGDYTLKYNGQQIIGAEKVGGRSESYTVYFQVVTDKETKNFSVTYGQPDDWNEYTLGNFYTLKVNHFNIVVNDPLREKNK